jgi:hypothetical protein
MRLKFRASNVIDICGMSSSIDLHLAIASKSLPSEYIIGAAWIAIENCAHDVE